MSWLGRDTVSAQYVRIKNWHSTYGGLLLFGLLWCIILSFLDHMETPVWLPVCHSRLPIFFSPPVGLSDFTDPWGLGGNPEGVWPEVQHQPVASQS